MKGILDASYSYQHNLEKENNRFEAINNAKVSFGLKPGKDTSFNMGYELAITTVLLTLRPCTL